MGKQVVLNSSHVVTGDTVTITETVEKNLSRDELVQEIHSYRMQQQQLLKQMAQLKERYVQFDELIASVEGILADFPAQIPEV